ncbi:MAG: hypothetical protein HC813_03855 [Planctomycetes bacterium]|nr:hypothetical protein [Planctomycetota bacterium]
MSRGRILIALLFATSLAWAEGPHPFGAHAGEAARLPAPDWMKEGTRIHWKTLTGSIPQQVPDPKTGQMTTVAPAGAGVTTADIVSLVGNTAGISVRTYVKSQFMYGGEALSAPIEMGLVLPAAHGNEYWVHPSILKKTFESLGKEGPWTGLHGPYEWEGRKVAAYQFTTGGGKADIHRTSLVYDEKTGILLFGLVSQRKSVQEQFYALLIHEFLALRDRQLPWAEGRPPGWLARIAAYEYRGSIVYEMEGMPPTPIGLRSTLTPDSVGTNYITYKLKTQLEVSGPPGMEDPPSKLISGPTQVGGLWLPPLEIRKLRAGQVCDRDPTLESTLVVQHVGGTQYGRNVVTLREDAPGYTIFLDYEIETGMLLLLTVKNKLMQTSTQLAFVAKQRAQAAPGGR